MRVNKESETEPLAGTRSTFTSNIIEASLLQHKIQQETIGSLKLMPLYGFLTSIMYKMRAIIFVLYAREFSSDLTLISWIVDLDWVVSGTVGISLLYVMDVFTSAVSKGDGSCDNFVTGSGPSCSFTIRVAWLKIDITRKTVGI